MAWGWDQSDDAHRDVYGGEKKHESHFSHELLAGAASFEGMKLFEDHQRKQGKTVSHAFAKEVIAGLVGAEVDKLAETKGMDEIDKLKAHKHAKENAHRMYEEHYERGHGAPEFDPRFAPHDRF
ncbi:CipC-like antibiotic response protein, partial [Aspergillus heteromorphus CBS 117.55]